MNINIHDVKPVGKRVLVEVYEAPQQTDVGIFLPEKEHAATPVLGTVIVAGDESRYTPGQTVFFRRYSLDELKFSTDKGEQKLHLLEDEEIVGFIKSNETNQ